MALTQHTANERQVGGDHYKGMVLEHWDITALLGLDYFQGQITRYVMRWRDKGGIQDLEKARHVLDKYIELEKLLRDGKPAMIRALLMQSLDKLAAAEKATDEFPTIEHVGGEYPDDESGFDPTGLEARHGELDGEGLDPTGLDATTRDA